MKHVSRACEFLKKTKLSRFQESFDVMKGHWLVSERYNLVACKTQKVGHTSIARVLYTLDNVLEGRDRDGLNLTQGGGEERRAATLHFINTPREKAALKLSKYTKFMFVREPLERLLSAYRDNRPAHWFGMRAGSKKLSFHEYILIVLDATADGFGNPHVISYARVCNPCGIKYNFIGTLDNFDSDMKTILDYVGADKDVVPKRDQFYQKRRTKDDMLQTYLKDVPKSVIERFYIRYFWDYFIFGFPKPDF